jgi:two-component sensor histidine kinase
MAANSTLAPTQTDLLSHCLEEAPLAMVMVEGSSHIVRYVNPAFCRLLDKPSERLVGMQFCEILPKRDQCVSLLDRVFHTGKPESHTEQDHSKLHPAFWSFMIWPVLGDKRPVGVMIQVTETTQFHETTLAMNEALILGSLRQHELTAVADSSNIQLQTEISHRKQRERDALVLTYEVSHRIKNNLQIIASLIAYEIRGTAAPCVEGYNSMAARIRAIAELYDLISQSSRGQTVAVDAYLREISKTMSASLLGDKSGIKIEVEAEALDIDPDHAVPFGLLVNELATNALKHAFPDGTGRVVLGVEQIGDEIELTVADNGAGMKERKSATIPEKHGADYVAIFARQLGGTISFSESEEGGTIVRVRLPLFVVPQGA